MTYDQWKTTDPRDYEPEPEEAPTELEEVYLALAEAQVNAKHAAERDAARIKELESALSECLEYFMDRYDVVDGPEGHQLPNKEMRLGTMVDEALHGILF